MSARRSDTRERIQQVALELFAERGYDKTSLREVAERLDITRPALYYHFKTKEDILVGVIEDLTAGIDELVEWAGTRPKTRDARLEILERIAGLLEDQWRPLIRFAQVNQGVLNELPVGERMRERFLHMVSVLSDPADDPVRQFEARLAVIALIFGSVPMTFGMDLPDDQRSSVALQVATKLIAGTE